MDSSIPLMDSSIPLLTPFTSYSEWKLKMIAYLKRQGIYEVYIGLGKEYYKDENEWLNDSDRYFGTIGMTLWKHPSFHYLIEFAEYPKDLYIELDRIFGKHNEDC